MSVAMVLLVAAMVMAAGTAEAQQTCASKLVPCASYLNGTKPSSECCDSIKEAVNKELPCLCTLYNTPGLLESFGVTVPQALNITRACGVPVRLQDCNGKHSTLSLSLDLVSHALLVPTNFGEWIVFCFEFVRKEMIFSFGE